MKRITFLLLFTVSLGFSQKELNAYKYIIVPTKYEFQKRENQYRINTIVKKLFEDYGYTAVYANNLPADLKSNRCLGVLSDIENGSGLFSTRLKVVLKDCEGREVFRTQEGKSKIKDFDDAYHEALRKAFQSFSGARYTYTPKQIKAVEQAETVKEAPRTGEIKAEKKKEAVIAQEQEVVTEQKQEVLKTLPKEPKELLYAQARETGYQLVDSTPEIKYILLKTDLKDVFIVKSGGLVYRVGGKWMLEYYEGSQRTKKELHIKF